MVKYIFATLTLSLVATAGAWLDQNSRPAANHVVQPRETNVVYASGRVEGATRDVNLRFEVPGRISEICVREGDFVEAGGLLMRLESEDGEQRVAFKQAEWELAEAQLARLKNGAHEQERLEAQALWSARQAEHKRAQQTWERTAQLRDRDWGTITNQEVDNRRAEVDTFTFQVAAAKARLDLLNAPARADEVFAAQARCDAAAAQLKLAKAELAKSRLVAPSAGIVAKLGHETGELTGPQAPEPAVLMIDNRRLRVRAFVDEQDTRRVCLGQAVNVKCEACPGSPLTGTVCELSPRMSPKQSWSDKPDERFDLRAREVVIELSAIDGMLPGLSVDVEIQSTGSVEVAGMEHERPRLPTPLAHGEHPKIAASIAW